MPIFITAALKLTTSLMTQQTFLRLDQHNFRGLAIQFVELSGQHVNVHWVIL